MYIRMFKKQIRYFIQFIIILLIHGGLHSQESVINIGESDLWNNTQLTNLTLIEGKRGFLDITSADEEYNSDKYTDLILSLNNAVINDKSGNYTIINQVEYIQSADAFGGGAAFFDGNATLSIKAEENALFMPSTLWGDFSLEFRMLPATLKEGSTVLLWKGLHKKDNALIPQEIRCTINNRKLVWDFENFFINPNDTLERISLSGDKLIPGIWSHHMITFDSTTGLLEYKINNIPADNTYTSRTGNETSEFNIPLIGNQQSFPMELGKNYSGLIDELRISKRVIDFPVLNKYSQSGYLETEVIDLQVPDSQLLSINVEKTIPINTSISFQYASSNNKFELLGPEAIWEEFTPSSTLNKRGQFVKIRAQLYSETAGGRAPVLTNISLVYQEADHPPPPLDVIAEKINGNIKISWKKSINPEIKGYLVYYGEKPGEYFSTGSPIDSGENNYIILEGLNINKRYYFAVTSYKSLNPRLESIFSYEINISP